MQGVVRFEWTYPGTLGPNQAFQVLIWKEGDTEHQGAADSQGETWQLINLDTVPILNSMGAGEYMWSVVVIDKNTDERLSKEATSRSFVYLGPAPTPPPTRTPLPIIPTWPPTPSPTSP